MKALYTSLRLAGISLGFVLMLPSWAAAQSVAAPLPAAATPAAGQEKIPHYRVAVDLPEAVKYGAMSIELAKKLSDRDEVGVMISGGTPERLQFERFILMRVGGLYNRFVLGTRETGVGFHGSLRYVYTSGETDATTDASALSASAHGLLAEASLVLRATSAVGLQIELRTGFRWLSSFATAEMGDATQESTLHTMLFPATLHMGWSF